MQGVRVIAKGHSGPWVQLVDGNVLQGSALAEMLLKDAGCRKSELAKHGKP